MSLTFYRFTWQLGSRAGGGGGGAQMFLKNSDDREIGFKIRSQQNASIF